MERAKEGTELLIIFISELTTEGTEGTEGTEEKGDYLIQELLKLLEDYLENPEKYSNNLLDFEFKVLNPTEEIKPEIIDDLLTDLAFDLDYCQWDKEDLIEGDDFIPEERMKYLIGKTLNEIKELREYYDF